MNTREGPSFRIYTTRALIFLGVLGTATVLSSLVADKQGLTADSDSPYELGPPLSDRIGILPNEWLEISARGGVLPYFRTDHGGAVYDSDRNSVLLFGSDTHLHRFDNRVYELKLADVPWNRLSRRTPRYTMRTNSDGARVAGVRGETPWPMHIYDSMVYDPRARAVVVLSGAKHNFVPRPGKQLDPLWAFSPERNAWRILKTPTPDDPVFFAAGAVYDPIRDVIIAYGSLAEPIPFVPLAAEDEVRRTGVWELGPDRSTWHLVSGELHHWGWFNLEFDIANRVMLVFGGHKGDSSIWAYEVGDEVGQAGRWFRRSPAGDHCPGGYYFPAAYDRKREVTFYMPVDRATGRRITCVYDYAKNSVRRLHGAELDDAGLNYTMVYAAREDLFLLVTGSYSQGVPVQVWILKPDLSVLNW